MKEGKESNDSIKSKVRVDAVSDKKLSEIYQEKKQNQELIKKKQNQELIKNEEEQSQRNKLVNWAIRFISTYYSVVALILISQSLEISWISKLDKSILIALLTSSTVTALLLPKIIVSYLFSQK